jgi:spore coat protein U-like protein
MRDMKACALVALCALMAVPTLQASAAGQNNLGTSATVAGTCRVTTPPGILDFGMIDPSRSTDATASTSFAIKCTKDTVSTAASDNNGLYFSGTKRMRHSATSTAFLPYAVTYSGDTGFTGQGFGPTAQAQTVTVRGLITPDQFQNALVTKAGEVYTDTVTITVNP